MNELRWNPLLSTWVMVATARQNRPHMDENQCPFCPSSGNVRDYDVMEYDNDFPALMAAAPKIKKAKKGLYKNDRAFGKCEVILYSPDHKANLYDLPAEHIEKIVNLWVRRCKSLARNKKNKFIFVFENKGEEVGVTMLHPHGQIYAYPFVPLKIAVELDSARSFYEKSGKCILCEMNREEKRRGERVIYENENFIAYIPYFTDYPYGVFIASKQHKPYLASLNARERKDLADILKVIEGAFDCLFNRSFPFMMCMHQCPVNSPEYKNSKNYFHLHIEFYTPLRAKDRIKYYASSESGAWAATNVALVEDTSREMTAAKLKYLAKADTKKFKEQFLFEFGRMHKQIRGRVNIFKAPARTNIIGEHIDYNGGYVMPVAINLGCYTALRKRNDKRIIIKDINRRETIVLKADLHNKYNKKILWPNYPAGVLNEFYKLGLKFKTGFDVLFFSDIPIGSGLSSSAAFTISFAYALSGVFGFDLDKKKIALLCKRAENDFVGVSCGIMDQFAATLSVKGNAMLLNCNNLKYEYIPFKSGKYRIVIIDSNKKRELSDSKYNERTKECARALKLLSKKIKANDLCSITPVQFEKYKNLIKDKVLLKRATHVIYENERVKKAAVALKNNDFARLGKLLVDSHVSLKDNYEVTGFELNTLFEVATSQKGCIGSRMTGAGFGGCTINIVRKDCIYDFKKNVIEQYRKITGLYPDFYECDAAQGAMEI